MALSQTAIGFRLYVAAWLACVALSVPTAWAQEKPLVLMIQPDLDEAATRRTFAPLAARLSKATGKQVVVATRLNFLAHWEMVRRDRDYDLVIDDAHFTDYRVQKFDFRVVAKLPGTISYSLVVLKEKRLVDPLELAGKPVASFGPPSIGATRLNAIFNNPSRRPVIIDISSAAEGIDLLLRGKVTAAMLPTPVVSEHISAGTLRVVTTTEPIPHMAFSISPRLDPILREKIRAALLDAKIMKSDPSVPRNTALQQFEAASAATYANQARLLQVYWGY